MEIPETNEDMEQRKVGKKFHKNTSTHEIMSAQRSRDYTIARASPINHARASPTHFQTMRHSKLTLTGGPSSLNGRTGSDAENFSYFLQIAQNAKTGALGVAMPRSPNQKARMMMTISPSNQSLINPLSASIDTSSVMLNQIKKTKPEPKDPNAERKKMVSTIVDHFFK